MKKNESVIELMEQGLIRHMVTERTAKRLNEMAKTKNLSVCINASKNSRGHVTSRWYSVGNNHAGNWHQITGFKNSQQVINFLNQYGK